MLFRSQLKHFTFQMPHRTQLPRTQQYASPQSPQLNKKLLALPLSYGSWESRRYRAALRLADTGPTAPSELPPAPLLASVLVSIPIRHHCTEPSSSVHFGLLPLGFNRD